MSSLAVSVSVWRLPALVTKPSLILADEPTGNLDYANAQGVFDILSELQQDFNTALLMVTHDRQLAKLADKQLALQNWGVGQLVLPKN